MLDPRTQTYKFIFNAIKNDTTLRATLKESNFIDLSEDDIPSNKKPRISPAGYPFITLMLDTGSEQNQTATSSSGELTQDFSLILVTAETAVSDANGSLKYILPLKFAVERALQPVLTQSPSANDLPFQVNVQGSGWNDALDDDENQRGTSGWSSEYNLTATIYVSRTDGGLGEFR